MISSLVKAIESVLTLGKNGQEFEMRVVNSLEKIYRICEQVMEFVQREVQGDLGGEMDEDGIKYGVYNIYSNRDQ